MIRRGAKHLTTTVTKDNPADAHKSNSFQLVAFALECVVDGIPVDNRRNVERGMAATTGSSFCGIVGYVNADVTTDCVEPM